MEGSCVSVAEGSEGNPYTEGGTPAGWEGNPLPANHQASTGRQTPFVGMSEEGPCSTQNALEANQGPSLLARELPWHGSSHSHSHMDHTCASPPRGAGIVAPGH
eukprot:1158947-Pelagomonas_calceolata.AAC.2